MSALLDETTTWTEFGRKLLDRRIVKALTGTLGLHRPTLVQSKGIPVALDGKDLLCRARTGSGKTIAYAVPMLQRLLAESEAKGSHTPLSGLILVPTKELIAQVHGVFEQLLSFCYDVVSCEPLLGGQKYSKAELPTVLVTTPSSLLALIKDRQGTMQPLSETLKMVVIDEADLMFSFGYEEDMRAMCGLMPSTYQALLVSATLSEEVEELKGLMLHKPVQLKLEEPRVTGKLNQFYYVVHESDKLLILYTLIKLQLVSGKTLIFVQDVESAYRLKIFFEKFSINSAVLNEEIPHATRQNIIQSFNCGIVDLLIATDDGFGDAPDEGTAEAEAAQESDEEEVSEQAQTNKSKKRKQKAVADAVVEGEVTTKKKKRKTETGTADDEVEADVPSNKPVVELIEDGAPQKKKKGKQRKKDEQYSLTRGVDLQGVTTVINADVPRSVRGYVHRVGRCARAGASGTALTIVAKDEDEPMLMRIMDSQASEGGMGEVKALPMQLADAERFRYRVEDQAGALKSWKTIAKYRTRELTMEALHSEKLKEYFEEHAEEKLALQKSQRQLRMSKAIRENLKTVPSYLVPEQVFLTATPVQKAVMEAAAASGVRKGSSALQRRKKVQQAQKDPLSGFMPDSRKKGKAKVTREMMINKQKKMDPVSTSVEDLPPISGRKLWALNHGQEYKRKTEFDGQKTTKQTRYLAKKRKKKFGF